jgi:hypothetical protein
MAMACLRLLTFLPPPLSKVRGTVLAAMALWELQNFDSRAGAKTNIRDAIDRVATRLGNTPTICRKCYIHPEILSSHIEGALLLKVKKCVASELRDGLPDLTPVEAAVVALLQTRLGASLKETIRCSARLRSIALSRVAFLLVNDAVAHLFLPGRDRLDLDPDADQPSGCSRRLSILGRAPTYAPPPSKRGNVAAKPHARLASRAARRSRPPC